MAERSTSSPRLNRAATAARPTGVARATTAAGPTEVAPAATAARPTEVARPTVAARSIGVSRSSAARPGLTHLDEANRPTMVDVGAKDITQRVAVAEARIKLPRNVAMALRKSGHRTKKGPVFDTAIVAGVMAAKKTHELIPF